MLNIAFYSSKGGIRHRQESVESMYTSLSKHCANPRWEAKGYSAY